ncbi:uncharacterized protein LOC144108615 [Amblyomma americanum]
MIHIGIAMRARQPQHQCWRAAFRPCWPPSHQAVSWKQANHRRGCPVWSTVWACLLEQNPAFPFLSREKFTVPAGPHPTSEAPRPKRGSRWCVASLRNYWIACLGTCLEHSAYARLPRRHLISRSWSKDCHPSRSWSRHSSFHLFLRRKHPQVGSAPEAATRKQEEPSVLIAPQLRAEPSGTTKAASALARKQVAVAWTPSAPPVTSRRHCPLLVGNIVGGGNLSEKAGRRGVDTLCPTGGLKASLSPCGRENPRRQQP